MRYKKASQIDSMSNHATTRTAGKGFKHIRLVVNLLEPRERRKLYLVGIGAVFMAFIEVLGVGSIMPFMAVASKPEVIHTNEYLSRVYQLLGFTSERSFLIFLGIGLLAFLILTNGSHAFMHYAKTRFTSMRRHSLGMKLIRRYLGQPYDYFLSRNSFDFVKNLNSEIQNLITGTLMQMVEVIHRSIQVLLLTTFLFVVDPSSTIVVIGAVGVLYGLVFSFLRRLITRIGKERFEQAAATSRVVSEAFWGIKEVKLAGIEQAFADQYAKPSKRLALNLSKSELVGDLPKFALETAAFSSIIIIVLTMIASDGGFADAAATVSLFAYAGYRLIPAIQALFKAFTKLRYSAPTAERISKEFIETANARPLIRRSPARMPVEHGISVVDLSFRYPGSDRDVLSGINLQIPANALVGLAGRTGSGKTTLVDIILGLLEPTAGALLIDDTRLTKDNLPAWQANLGYVPQNIHLSNRSIAENIAFGVLKDSIDMSAVEQAARLAQIHDFIVGELPGRYDTDVGERGIRLSGGQRQRVGIARALYRDPKVLVMDEATSALDGHTEKTVMEAIDSLQGSRTIILIAHRLSTLSKCDTIFQLEHGVLVDSGTHEELKGRNEYFSH